jgi:hypothetical protein
VILCAQDDHEMLEMFAREFDVRILPNTATFIAFRDASGMLGGWMFERYTGPGGSIYIHWAANRKKRWMTRHGLGLCGAYVFGQLGCTQVLGEAPATDTYVCKLNEKVGFREIARIDGYFPDGAMVLYRMRWDECRWLPAFLKGGGTNGQT